MPTLIPTPKLHIFSLRNEFFLKQNILFFQPKNVNNRDVSTLVYIEAFIDTSLLVDTLTCVS